MSGGHFDHQDSMLRYVAERLEMDIDFNDVETPNRCGCHGYQHSEEVLWYMEKAVQDLNSLADMLHEYDLGVSGDTDIESFRLKAKERYGDCE